MSNFQNDTKSFVFIFRDFWEIKSNQLALESEKFEMTWKKKIIQKVIAELGCKASEEVNVSAPRAVLYGKGASVDLKSDEDNDSVTLIVQLPSVFTGNNLTIHHDDESKTVKFDCKNSKYEIIYGAFYSECKYELSPLESGYRLVLVYKLTWNDCKIPQSRINESKEATQKVTSALSQVTIVLFMIIFDLILNTHLMKNSCHTIAK